MPLSYLKHTEFMIPTGYSVGRGSMTADSRRVYFAAAHDSQPTMLIYDMNGGRQEAAEFNIHALGAGRSFDAIAHDAENLYLVSNSPGLGSIADVYPYSKLGTAGRRFALEGIADNLNSAFEAVKGAVFLNEEIVVLLQRTVGAARLSMARFRPDGSYVSKLVHRVGNAFARQIRRGMTLAGNQVFVLDAMRILALDRGFAYVASENVAVTSLDPVSVGWNGNALLVYDDGRIDFYGGEQPTLVSVPSMPPRQYRSRAFKKYEETLDVMKRNADGSLMKRGIGVKGLRFSTIEEVYVSESADLTTQLRLFTIILLRPLPEIEVDDFIFRNTGAMEGNPPMDLPPERYQVKGFGEWGDRYKQVLYCVQGARGRRGGCTGGGA